MKVSLVDNLDNISLAGQTSIQGRTFPEIVMDFEKTILIIGGFNVCQTRKPTNEASKNKFDQPVTLPTHMDGGNYFL